MEQKAFLQGEGDGPYFTSCPDGAMGATLTGAAAIPVPGKAWTPGAVPAMAGKAGAAGAAGAGC